jgi:uncharacterized repeat protein (TIGR02543 family)
VPKEIDGIKTYGFGYAEGGSSLWSGYNVGDFRSEKLERLYLPFETGWDTEKGTYKLPNCSVVEWYKAWNIDCIYVPNYILGYNVFKEIQDERQPDGRILANVSYLYNYENSPNDDYYWVDSYDNSTVKYIPPEPTREGYTFGGWYKEAECINAWDFEVDKTGPQIDVVIDSTIEDYNLEDITFLYAKWNEK